MALLMASLRYTAQCGIMHQGKVVFNKGGAGKQRLSIDGILAMFNETSVEFGN